MLPTQYIIIAVALRLAAGAGYSWAVLQGRAKPNAVTWFFWGLSALIAFVAQINNGIRPEAWATLALALGPLIICALALIKNPSSAHFTPTALACGGFATVGLVLWQLTDNPILAILFSIGADIFGSVPTVIKAYRQPYTEVAFPYLLSMASMVLTLCTITQWDFVNYAFPAYIFTINMAIFSIIVFRSRQTLDRQGVSTGL